jgi:hypothetical protein
VVLTTPPRKKFLVTKLHIARQPRFFKNCRATEEEEELYIYNVRWLYVRLQDRIHEVIPSQKCHMNMSDFPTITETRVFEM